MTASKIAKGALGFAACTAALLAASVGGAQAQGYGGAYDNRGYAYDPCARDTTQRGTTGGLAGAALGAAIGGSAAAGGAKTEGAVLGGVLGAIAGNQIGKRSAACAPGQVTQGYSQGYYSEPAYAPAPPPPPPSAYYQEPRGGAYAQSGTYYDPCVRDRTTRGTTGGLAGGAIGALAGGNIAARNARTEGAVLGAIAGAVVGSKVGKNSAACAPGGAQYGDSYSEPSPYAYDQGDRYGTSYREERRDYGYDSRYAAPVADARTDVNGCTLAESPIYLPDGRTQKRFVRVCPDGQGRYQVVD